MQRSRRVLVIEDDPDIRGLLVALLADDGYDVQGAQHGLDGLAVAAHWSPDLLVLDLDMPIMDGREFLEARRAVAQLRSLPVIVVTARADVRTIAREVTRQLDVAVVLRKPFEADALLARVARLIGDEADRRSTC